MMIVFLVSIDLFVFPVCLSYNTKRVPDFNIVSRWNKMRIKNGSILNMSFEDVDILINQTGAGPSFNESEYYIILYILQSTTNVLFLIVH